MLFQKFQLRLFRDQFVVGGEFFDFVAGFANVLQQLLAITVQFFQFDPKPAQLLFDFFEWCGLDGFNKFIKVQTKSYIGLNDFAFLRDFFFQEILVFQNGLLVEEVQGILGSR